MQRAATATAVFCVLLAGIAVAGCGAGLGAGERGGSAGLLVTADFGSRTLLDRRIGDLAESDTVLRVLERNAEIETLHGGGFVQSIDGLSAGTVEGRPHDWLYFVNGVEADRGSAEHGVAGGDRIWWDYRDWSAAISVPAVVGQFPQPFSDGDSRPAVRLDCRGAGVGSACAATDEALGEAGAATTAARESGEAGGADAIRVLVGTWAALSGDPAIHAIERGPGSSGVFVAAGSAGRTDAGADGSATRTDAGAHDPATDAAGGAHAGADAEADASAPAALIALDSQGEPVRQLPDRAGLVAATRIGGRPPVWLITGTELEGVEAAAGALDEESLHARYAVAVTPDGLLPLPAR